MVSYVRGELVAIEEEKVIIGGVKKVFVPKE